MKSFAEWLKDNNPGNYVSVGLGNLPTHLVEDLPGKINPEPHATLMYSKQSGVPVPVVAEMLKKHDLSGQAANVTGAKCFPDSKEPGLSCVVLTLDHPSLHAIHQDLGALGAKHSFYPFEPHATLMYQIPTELAEQRAKELNETVKGTQLPFGEYENHHINEGWVDSLK